MAKGKERPIHYHCQKVRIGDAGVKGRGVFATCAIGKGEAVESAPALEIPLLDVKAIESTFLSKYSFAHNDDFELIGLGYISLYNHSFTPNAHFVLTRKAILVVAKRAIAIDEEITFDYGWSDEGFREDGIALKNLKHEGSLHVEVKS